MSKSSAHENWVTWTLSRWNDALVDAVFLQQDGAPSSITRIDATNAFLARVVGAAPSEEDAVRASFIGSFRTRSVRFLFESSEQFEPWKPSLPELPFFAQLYLSVMVAGADETTHDIGNFRERLAAMLDAPEAVHLQLEGLPVLWRAAARWTRKTVRPSIRQLMLPNPKHETRIGYSKRLAFPAFNDQSRLAKLLSETALTAQSPAVRIIQSVSRRLDQFTDRFQEEFREFRELYRKSEHSRALASPFWGALQDISWSVSTASGDRPQKSKFVLELDVIDAHAPALLLRSDRALSPRHLPWRSTRRGFYRDGRPYEISPEAGNVTPSPDALRSPAARMIFGHSRAWQSLNDGCVAFGRDEFGAWIDVGSLSQGQSFWLLLMGVKGERLRATLARAGRTPQVCGCFGDVRAWMLVGPFEFSESLRALLESAIHDSLFEHRLVAPRIRVAGGLQLPEGYLFLLGCAPHVSMHEAASFRWSATVGAGASFTGELVPESKAEETTSFAFRVDDVRERLNANQRIDVVALDADDNVLDHTFLRAVTECNGWILKRPIDRHRWREIGNAGDLAGLEDVGRTSPQEVGTELSVRPVVACNERWIPPREVDLEAMPQRWQELVEILTATFMRAAAVSAQDMLMLVRRVWDIDSRAAWLAIQDLIDNGLVEQVFNRRWHGSVFLACAPTAEITVVTDHSHLRVMGLTPAGLRREIVSRARVLGGRACLSTDPTGTTCGVLQARLPSLAEAQALCRDLELPHRVHEPDEREAPFAPWARLLVPRTVEVKGELSLWSEARGAFLTDLASAREGLRLEQWRQEGHQPLYVLRTQAHSWSTRSRTWALLAREALAGATLGEIATDGSVRLVQTTLAMPPRVAREVLRRGGGVCYRDEMGKRIYPAGEHWAPAALLSTWVRRPVDPVKRDLARERLRAALSSATQVPESLLRRYW